MSDVNANIGVHIDTSQALAELKSLQRQLALFHTSIAKGSASAAAQQRNMQQNLLNTINATGKFSAQMGVVRTSTESFTNSLEKNKFSMREYFRYAGGATKTFGRLFKAEFDTIGKVAEDRVKRLQTQYIKLGRDTSGAMRAISVTPTSLNMKDYGTQVALAAQKQALFNQLMKQGSTNLLNFGKNTQWAGRQLMVGFSIPLAYLGTAAAKTFMDLEAQAIRFKRVYGDMFTTTEQTNKALADVRNLAEQFTKYGVAVVDTMKMAADAAAMGKTGADLTAQVAQATRLAVLGGVEQGQALETTISITNAFGTAAEDLAKKINFLNAVENQTVVSIEDLTIAIPKAGPVVKQLGGDVEDLAFFLTAMKEGGINASEGANALKSGLASLINPTKKASEMLSGFGINIKSIVETNKGNIRQTVIDFSRALDTLDPLNRARAIEQLFGKFQFARLSTLFQNVTKDGTQASKVLGLTTNSIEQLAIMSERELGTIEDAVSTKFKKSIQDLKLTLEPIGKTFLEAITPIAQSIAGLLDKFNNLGSGTKKFIVVATTLVGIIGPSLLMTFGLLANGAANIVKLFLAMRGGFLRLSGNSKILSEQTNYLNAEQLEAATVASSLNQAHSRLTQQFTMEAEAVRLLRKAYIDATVAAANFARTNPGMMMPGTKGGKAPKKFARGTQYVPGTGNKDTVPAVLTPGEAVIPKDVAQDPRFQPIIDAMVNGNLQGFDVGTENAQPSSNTKRIRRKKVRGNATLTKDGKVFFRGKRFTTSSQLTSRKLMDQINLQLAEADAEGGVGRKSATKTILNRMEKLQAKEGKVSASRVFKHIVSGRSVSGGAGSNNPQILKLRKEINAQTAGSGLDRETVKLKAALAGAGLSQKEQADFLRKQESHILKPQGISGSSDPRKWQAGQVVSDYAGVNNYLNRAGASAIGSMIDDITKDPSKVQTLGYTPKQVRQLSYDYAFAKTGKHPTTSKEFQSISRIAKFEVDMHEKGLAKIDKINQAKGVSALTGVRQPSFYKNLHKRVIQLGTGTASRVSRGKVEGLSREQQRQIASGVVTGQTGVAKPARAMTTSGAPSEKRQVAVGKNETILNKKTTTALKSGKPAFVPGLGRFRMINSLVAGAEDGIPTGQKTGSTTMGAATQSARLSRAQLLAATEKISLKEAKRRIASEVKLTNAMDETTKAQMTTKEKLSAFSGKASVGIGAVSGLTIAASFAGGKLGEMAQKIMPFVFGLQGIVMLLPLLANPWVAAVAALALVSTVVIKMAKDIEKARQEGINLAKAMSMTSDKLIALSTIAGTVSASEEADRRRQNIVSGTTDAQRRFGQNTLESEVGKQIVADIEMQAKSGQSIKEISTNLANNLAVAVAQGAVTTDQARSIAAALGEKLGSYEIPALVSGKLVSLLGPNGENLATDPLQVTLKIQKESMQKQSDFFKTAISSAISESTAPNVLARFAGFGLIAAGIATTLATGGVAAGAGIAAAGAGAMMLGEADANKRKAVNVKLAAAAVQLGIEQVTQNNGLVDALNKQYDTKIKMAKTEAEIKSLEDQRAAGIAKLNASNATALNLLIQQKDAIGSEAFTKGINASVDALYKEGPMKVFADEAKKSLDGLKDSEFKATLQIGFASGEFNPLTVKKIIDIATTNKDFETKIKFSIEKEGFANTDTLVQLLSKTGASNNTIDILLNYVNKNDKSFETDLAAVSSLADFAQTYGITLDLKTNGVTQVMTATNALKTIETLPDRLTKEMVAKLAEENPGEWQAFYDQWTIISEGKDVVNKKLKVAFDVASKDKNVLDYISAEGIKVGDVIARGSVLPGEIPGGGTPPTGDGKRDTILDDLLLKLKLFRKESVNALGGWKELIKQLGSGKTINAFKGTANQLQNMGGNESLVQFAQGLGAEEAGKFFDKITSKAKNGKLVLNDYGKSLNRLFPTVQAGIYLRQQDQITREQTTQNKALAMLKSRGIDAATALELTADAATAAAIVSKDLDGKDLETMINRTKKATAATKEFEKALRATQFAADEMAEGAAEKINEQFDFAYLEIERKARETFKSVNGMAPEAVELSITIDENAISKIQDEISGINSEIKLYSRTLDLIGRQETAITEAYDKKIESVNKQIDALESIKTLNSFLISQQQKQLGLANALTQGDISAAAEAVQAMRAESAQAALDRMTGGLDTAATNLEAQKQKEISAITAVVNGQKMTRKQIDEQILLLNDKIYTIETTQLEPLQAQADKKRQLLSDLDFQIQKEQMSLEINGMTKTEWDFIQRYTDAANKHLDGIVIDIDMVASSSASAAASWKSILESMRSAAALKMNSGSTDINYITQGAKSGTITPENVTEAQKAAILTSIKGTIAAVNSKVAELNKITKYKMYGGKVKYMATGGMAVGSDTVPAMLTPGEFVVNRAAAQQFGPMLQSINESKYPSMLGGIGGSTIVPVNNISTSMNDNSTAVYNYNLGFNINGNTANANEIARAVMREVKNVDAQRIRRQRA